MNTGQINSAIPSSDDFRLEYDHLRKEILHNNHVTMQIFLGVIALLSVLMIVTFGLHTQSLLIKGIMFLFAMMIGLIGLDQTIARERNTFIIASYLRTFIEPITTGIKWEGRLQEFRARSHAKSIIPRSEKFINFLWFTYPSLIIINFLFFAVFVLSEFWTYPRIYVAGTIAVVLSVAIYMLLCLHRSWLTTQKYIVNHAIHFDPIWQEIRDQEKRKIVQIDTGGHMENQLRDDLQPPHDIKIRFLVEEYQALRREIEIRMKNTFWVFLTAVPIIGYAYYFFLQNPEKILCRLFFFLPIIYLLPIAGMLFMMIRQIKEIGAYIRKVEELLSPAGFGWETYLDNKNKKHLFKYDFLFLYYSWFLLLFLGSIIISSILYMNKQ